MAGAVLGMAVGSGAFLAFIAEIIKLNCLHKLKGCFGPYKEALK
jgi:hypothetical protein